MAPLRETDFSRSGPPIDIFEQVVRAQGWRFERIEDDAGREDLGQEDGVRSAAGIERVDRHSAPPERIQRSRDVVIAPGPVRDEEVHTAVLAGAGVAWMVSVAMPGTRCRCQSGDTLLPLCEWNFRMRFFYWKDWVARGRTRKIC